MGNRHGHPRRHRELAQLIVGQRTQLHEAIEGLRHRSSQYDHPPIPGGPVRSVYKAPGNPIFQCLDRPIRPFVSIAAAGHGEDAPRRASSREAPKTMRGRQDAPRADERPGTAGAGPGAEVAAKMDQRIPGKLRRSRFVNARVHRADDCKVAVFAFAPRLAPTDRPKIKHGLAPTGGQPPALPTLLETPPSRRGLHSLRRKARAQPLEHFLPVIAQLEKGNGALDEELGLVQTSAHPSRTATSTGSGPVTSVSDSSTIRVRRAPESTLAARPRSRMIAPSRTPFDPFSCSAMVTHP